MSFSEKPERSALTARAVAAAVSVATAHGINIDEPQVIADAYSVRIHLKPAPIVARVSTIRSQFTTSFAVRNFANWGGFGSNGD